MKIEKRILITFSDTEVITKTFVGGDMGTKLVKRLRGNKEMGPTSLKDVVVKIQSKILW